MSPAADFSGTCEGCECVIAEPWPRGEESYRCDAPSPWRGRIVGIRRFDPYIPAWCPKLNRPDRGEVKK